MEEGNKALFNQLIILVLADPLGDGPPLILYATQVSASCNEGSLPRVYLSTWRVARQLKTVHTTLLHNHRFNVDKTLMKIIKT